MSFNFNHEMSIRSRDDIIESLCNFLLEEKNIKFKDLKERIKEETDCCFHYNEFPERCRCEEFGQDFSESDTDEEDIKDNDTDDSSDDETKDDKNSKDKQEYTYCKRRCPRYRSTPCYICGDCVCSGCIEHNYDMDWFVIGPECDNCNNIVCKKMSEILS